MIDTDKYNIADDVVWIWNDDLDQKQGWVLWEYKECPAEKGYPVGSDPDKTYEPYHQVLPSLIFECKIDARMNAITDLPLLLAEVKRLREVVDKQQMQYVNLETAYYNSPSETEISRQIDSGVKHVCGEVKRVLNEEIKRLREKLFEAELWVNNESYTFENNIKELNDYAEARMNE